MQTALNVLSACLALWAAVVWLRSARVQPGKPIGSVRGDGSTDGLQELAAALKGQSFLSGRAAMLAAAASVTQAGALALASWRS